MKLKHQFDLFDIQIIGVLEENKQKLSQKLRIFFKNTGDFNIFKGSLSTQNNE